MQSLTGKADFNPSMPALHFSPPHQLLSLKLMQTSSQILMKLNRQYSNNLQPLHQPITLAGNLTSVGSISNIDVKIATLPKIASRLKSRFCLLQLSIYSLILIKKTCLCRH